MNNWSMIKHMAKDELREYTERIKNIVRGCAIIWQSGHKTLIAEMHHINDHYQNERERILYGDTLKNIYAKAKKERFSKNKN